MSKLTKPEQLVETVLSLERIVSADEKAMQQNEQFVAFLEAQDKAKKQIADYWAQIEKQMLDSNVKSIKGDWGSITIAERNTFAIDEETLAPRYFKRVPDTTKINTLFKLENKLPAGVTRGVTRYITKRIKVAEDK